MTEKDTHDKCSWCVNGRVEKMESNGPFKPIYRFWSYCNMCGGSGKKSEALYIENIVKGKK